jgi:signal transduction histidine kinase
MRISNHALDLPCPKSSYGRRLFFTIAFFGTLALCNAAVFSYLIVNTLGDKLITETYNGMREEAQKLKDRIERYGNTLKVYEHSTEILTYMNSMLVRKETIRKICLHDPQGRPVLELDASRGVQEWNPLRRLPEDSGGTRQGPLVNPTVLVREGYRRIAAPVNLQGEKPWEIQVELNKDVLDAEIADLRKELLLKILIGSVVSLGLLTIAFLYVLRQVKARQQLEHENAQREKMALIGTLASGLAHEIRNPLNAMSMNVQLLEEDLSDRTRGSEDTVSILEGTRKEIRRLVKLVSDFLLYARPEKLQLAKRNVNAFLDEILALFESEFVNKKIVIEKEYGSDISPVEIDPSKMRQALMNVLLNASQAVPEGGRIQVRTGMNGDGRVLIEIADNGPGIPSNEIPEIFKAFYSTKRGGTGLGLPITLNIVENHKGAIEVESELGKGAVFRIILPQETPQAA